MFVEKQGARQKNRVPINTWATMKEQLAKKYLPLFYRDHLLEQLSRLRYGSLSVKEHMTR